MTPEVVAPEDAWLVQRMATGDREALSELYHRYVGLLLGVALKIAHDRETAEDLVQDVFLEAWKKAATYDPSRASVRTWLLLRIRSRALDRVGSAPVRRTVSLEDASSPEPSTAGSSVEVQSDAQRIPGALQGVSAEQRQVLELTFFSGLTATEIAEAVGIPVGTVKSRLRAGLSALRATLRVEEGQ